jgi:hypothetical protein
MVLANVIPVRSGNRSMNNGAASSPPHAAAPRSERISNTGDRVPSALNMMRVTGS